MKNLKILVVGAGALGNEIIKNLALIGVGSMMIVDSDKVESSNLTRSILFCVPQIAEHIRNGEPKASLAANRAKEINSDIVTESFVGEIADFGLGKIKEFDLVFSGLDNELARLELSWACVSTNRLLVDGGLAFRNYSSGLVSVYPGANGPCYACRKSRDRRSALLTTLYGLKLPCAESELEAEANDAITTTPLMASVVAAIQVEEGLRTFFNGDRAALEGHSLEVTLHPRPRLERFSYSRSDTCPLHDMASESYAWDGKSATTTVTDLIDFVEDHERSECKPDRAQPSSDERSECKPDRAQPSRKEKAKASLTLRWPIIVSAYCNACRKTWHPVIRAARFRRMARCIHCGSKEVTEDQPLSKIDRESKWAHKTIAELGLPENHIHEFVIADNGHKRLTWVEIRD